MTSFTPVNLLEKMLLDGQQGKAPPSKLFGALFASKVFVLLNKPPAANGTWGDDTSILVLNNAAGSPMIAVFSAPERSAGWPERAPEFRHGAFVDFRWLVKVIAEGAGVVINPAGDVGVEMAAGLLRKLRDADATQ